MRTRLCAALLLTCLPAVAACAAPVVAPSAPDVSVAISGGERLLTLNVRETSVQTLLGLLADAGNVNMVVAGDVTGNVAKFQMRAVNVETAIQRLVTVAGLQLRKFPDGSYLIAKTLPALASEAAPETPMFNAPRDAVKTKTVVIRVRNRLASVLAYQLDPNHQASPFPTLRRAPREVRPQNHNFDLPPGVLSLVLIVPQSVLLVQIEDSPRGELGLQELKRLIAELDKPTRRVQIEAKFVRFKRADLDVFGIVPPTLATGNFAAGAAPEIAPRSIAVSYLPRDWAKRLQVLVNAKRAEVLASPRVEALNNLTAMITEGTPPEIGFSITPTVNGDNTVTLIMKATNPNAVQTIAIVQNDDTVALYPLRDAQGRELLVLITTHVMTATPDATAKR